MRALLRTSTLLTALIAFVLQLPLAGAGVGCRTGMHTGMGEGASMPGMHMPDMQMPDMQMPGSGAEDATPMPQDEAPCDHGPSSAACQSMASCASAVAVLLAVDVPAEHGTAGVGTPSTVVKTPTSHSIPPELPPPRI